MSNEQNHSEAAEFMRVALETMGKSMTTESGTEKRCSLDACLTDNFGGKYVDPKHHSLPLDTGVRLNFFGTVEKPSDPGAIVEALHEDHPYHTLAAVLAEAFAQAAGGKGAERHGQNLRFEDQRMLSITRLLKNPGGLSYQACKKVSEGMDLPTLDRQVAEMLGAINYIAGIVIFLREQARGE